MQSGQARQDFRTPSCTEKGEECQPQLSERQKQRNGLSANRNSYDDSNSAGAAARQAVAARWSVTPWPAVGRKAVAAAAATAADAVSLPMRPKGDLRYILSSCIATASG